jgi:hypothetical protein
MERTVESIITKIVDEGTNDNTEIKGIIDCHYCHSRDPFGPTIGPDCTDNYRDASVEEAMKNIEKSLEKKGYEELKRILELAYDQAAKGKGAERHGISAAPWHNQKIVRGQEEFGVGGALFQASKKLSEAMNLPPDRAKFELLGAIVYIAGAIYYLEKFNCHSNLKKDR